MNAPFLIAWKPNVFCIPPGVLNASDVNSKLKLLSPVINCASTVKISPDLYPFPIEVKVKSLYSEGFVPPVYKVNTAPFPLPFVVITGKAISV